ncbi:MAG: thiamine pyrophosphate-dependent enzyme [Planctomycetota bacterium]|jgi:pyruvate ferredoxin oxidoreductase beta subunit
MALNLKKLSHKPEVLAPGHRACAGCTAPIVFRLAMKMVDDDEELVTTICTGCMEVVTTIYPFSAWRCSHIHSAFENSAATCSGVEAAYQALKAKGKMKKKYKFIAFGGDGGTYDIGFQSLSGAMERGHEMLYICYDNEGYMNTGIQRSGATPMGAHTNTSQAGSVKPGKEQKHKDLTACIVAHDIPYVAQASVHNIRDLGNKIYKGLHCGGPAFLNVLAPCHRGWRFPVDKGIEMAKLATETNFWPLFEVENGVYKINYKPKEAKPIEEWFKTQARFKHLFNDKNKHIIAENQKWVDIRWQRLLRREAESEEEAKALAEAGKA